MLPISTIAVHLSLAVLEFFVINWLGRHAISGGYFQLSFFEQTDGPPAFNSLFRVLAPVVFLILTASLWYSLGLGEFVRSYYLVTVYYFGVRWLFNIVTGRRLLLKWFRQSLIAATSIAASYVLYTKIIRFERSLLPDPANLANEMWIIVLLFLYSTLNQVEWRDGPTFAERKTRYVRAVYRDALGRYGAVVRANASSRVIEALAFAILIYESFNRPAIYQALEKHILFPLNLARSIGPMQYRTDTLLSNSESVAAATRKLSRDYGQSEREYVNENRGSFDIRRRRDPELGIELEEPTPDQLAIPDDELIGSADRQAIILRTAAKYNIRSDYPSEVWGILEELIRLFYKDLMPPVLGEDSEVGALAISGHA